MEVLAMTFEGFIISTDAGVIFVPASMLKESHAVICHNGLLDVLRFVKGFMLGIDAANE